MILLIAATLFFGGRIVYSAVPYHGALSWKLDEWMRKKEVELEHNNLFEDGVEGILMDLDEALQLPEELYIANKYQVSFDENGTIQRIYAFIYGKNEAGKSTLHSFYVLCFLAWKKEGAGVLSQMPTVSMNRGMHRRLCGCTKVYGWAAEVYLERNFYSKEENRLSEE